MIKTFIQTAIVCLSISMAGDYIGLLEATRPCRRDYSPFNGQCLSQSGLIVGLRSQGFGAFDPDPVIADQERDCLQPNMTTGLNLIKKDRDGIVKKYNKSNIQETLEFLEHEAFVRLPRETGNYTLSWRFCANYDLVEDGVDTEATKKIQDLHEEYLADIRDLRTEFTGVPKNPIARWIQYLYVSHLSGVVVPSTCRYDVIGDLPLEKNLEGANQVLGLIIQFREGHCPVEKFTLDLMEIFNSFLNRVLTHKNDKKSTITGYGYRDKDIQTYNRSVKIVTQILLDALIAEREIATSDLSDKQIYPDNIVALIFLSFLYDRSENKSRLFYLSSVIKDDYNPVLRGQRSIEKKFSAGSMWRIKEWEGSTEFQSSFLNKILTSDTLPDSAIHPLYEMFFEPGHYSLKQFYQHINRLACPTNKLFIFLEKEGVKGEMKKLFDGLLQKFQYRGKLSFKGIPLSQTINNQYRNVCLKIIDALWVEDKLQIDDWHGHEIVWLIEHFLRQHLNSRDLYCVLQNTDNFDAHLPQVYPLFTQDDFILRDSDASYRRYNVNSYQKIIKKTVARINESGQTPSDIDIEQLAYLTFYGKQERSYTPVLAGYRGGVQVDACESFYNCGEIAMYNLFLILSSYRHHDSLYEGKRPLLENLVRVIKNYGGYYDVSKLLQIREFLATHPDGTFMDSLKAHNEWSAIVSNLNEELTEGDNRRIRYAKKDRYEIHGGGLVNMLNVLGRLIPDPILQAPWNEENIYDEITYKLLRFCEIFSISGHQGCLNQCLNFELTYREQSQGDHPMIRSKYGTLVFKIGQEEVFKWLLDPNHYDVMSCYNSVCKYNSSLRLSNCKLIPEFLRVMLTQYGEIKLDMPVSGGYDYYCPESKYRLSDLRYLKYHYEMESKYYPFAFHEYASCLTQGGLQVYCDFYHLAYALDSDFVANYFFVNLKPYMQEEVVSQILRLIFAAGYMTLEHIEAYDKPISFNDEVVLDKLLAGLIKHCGISYTRLYRSNGAGVLGNDGKLGLWQEADSLVKHDLSLFCKPMENREKFRLMMLQKQETPKVIKSEKMQGPILPFKEWVLERLDQFESEMANLKFPLLRQALSQSL